jgi:hypothetical protein
MENIAVYCWNARTGHFEHHLSTTFEQLAGFSLEVQPQEFQCILRVIVDEYAHQFHDLLIIQR